MSDKRHQLSILDQLASESGPVSRSTERLQEIAACKEDPHEFNNLSGNPAYAGIEHRLKAKLHEWMILNKDYLPLPIPHK